MALQDLTPQLRTRMRRVERLVGLFVFVAALLMASAFAYYLVKTGERRGWFVNKIPYFCYTRDAAGLKTGDPVRLLGREVGRIISIETSPPDPWFVENNYNVVVKFEIRQPYEGYVLSDSKVRVVSADFFGPRFLEVTRGNQDVGLVTVLQDSKRRFEDSRILWDDANSVWYIPLSAAKRGKWLPPDDAEITKADNSTNTLAPIERRKSPPPGIWLRTEESAQLTQRAEQIVQMIQETLPRLTNQVAQVLAQATEAASNASRALAQLQPTLTSVESIAHRLQTEEGAIGRMLLTTNLQTQVQTALSSMDATLTNTTGLIRTSEIQLQDLTRRIALTLDNVALVTSNLSSQVNANSLMLGEVSSLVVSADDMVQGLKRHWLLRSAFPAATNAPLESKVFPSLDLNLAP
ncbi:MAG: MCE family protein [Verrucomicrobiales bacterium]|nr:MCE family protein [Verrucomicrobiales bacterium]